MNETYKVREVGGALIVTLPQNVVRFVKLAKGDDVIITCHKNGTIVIKSVLTQLQRERRPGKVIDSLRQTYLKPDSPRQRKGGKG